MAVWCPSRRALPLTAFALAALGCGSDEARTPDARADAVAQAGFGRACTSDSQCEAEACVPHIGNTVCSQRCDPETPCPDGWTCWTPPASTPDDGRSFCVSPFWSLCRPCSANADCASLADDEPGTCVDYAGSGTFCGVDCQADADCPEGFSCDEVATRDGRVLRQCVDSRGMCECNAYVFALGEATRCAVENEYGRCHGERTCDSKLWSRCDARTPGPDAPNLIDDDCDGLTDELSCLCGDRVCDGACGETLANCPCDCAAEGDGICSPCGESPASSPVDCCRAPGGTVGCGDGFCMGFGCGENPATCPEDCGTACGNTFCEPGENPFNCAEDCKHEVCGNNVCESTDGGPDACPQDCSAFCGDCECDPARDESVFNCAIDCGYCGDGSCSACAVLGESATTCAADCCRPSAEACNGVDDDCDGETDEADAFGCRIYYRDDDGDGLGRWDDARCLCAPFEAWSASGLGDCADGDLAVGLGGDEVCNGADDDCDGQVDEGFDLGQACPAPGGPCLTGVTACAAPERVACVDGPPLAKGTLCAALTCADGVILPPASCDGAGQCVTPPAAHCDGFACDDAGRCLTSCESDDECRAGYACGVTGACELVAEPCENDLACIDHDWQTVDFCLVVCGHGERLGALATDDEDGDGVANADDNCAELANADQADRDGDGRGDACDPCEGQGSDERCNGLDDDCDGETDEGFGVGVSCVADGAPCRIGVRVCDGAGDTHCPASEDAPAGLACGDATCEGDDLRLTARCDGAGTCRPGALLPCQGFLCELGPSGPVCTEGCALDDDCAAGFHCAATPDGGACAPDLNDGSPCGDDGQCASGMCIDGFCCATACDGGCFTCGSAARPGQCVPVTAGTDPREACGPCATCNAAGACANVPAGPSPKDACVLEPPCGGLGLCDAQGQCRLAAAGTPCDEGRCFDGALTAGTTCDGQGECRDATTSTCPGDLLCASPSACLTRCTTDRDCRVGHFCDASGACADLRAQGQPCTADRMCATGICADGVCCDSRCAGSCESCASGTCTPHAAGTDPENACGRCGACNNGVCAPHAAGTDPDDDCSPAPPCLRDGFCDGAFGCAAVAAATPCGTASCVNATLISARACDGAGSCADPAISACVAYTCDAGGAACRTTCGSDSHCQGGFYCANGGQCLQRLAKGAACTRDGQCVSGACVEGVCCESACTDPCRACDAAGTCAALDHVEDPGQCEETSWCKAGNCVSKSSSCTTDEHCAPDYHCGDGQCHPDHGLGEACDNDDLECLSGHCVRGFCCESECHDRCESCMVSGFEGQCVPAPPGEDPSGLCELLEPGTACDRFGGCSKVDGQSCTAGFECISGVCDQGTCCHEACGVCEVCAEDGASCDALATGPDADSCSGAMTCKDGECLKGLGVRCTNGVDCASGNCADASVGDLVNFGICCDEPCDGACETCAPNGQCVPLIMFFDPEGLCDNTSWCGPDGNCTVIDDSLCEDELDCPPDHFCDGVDGTCERRRPLGQPCTRNEECDLGRICSQDEDGNGICCTTPCNGDCDYCDPDGICRPYGPNDPGQCEDPFLCNGKGDCAEPLGSNCLSSGECASGNCSPDSVCCSGPCDGLCERCDVDGLCKPVLEGPDEACNTPFECQDRNICRLADGQPCASPLHCASNICEDGYCCATPCPDGSHCTSQGLCALDVATGDPCTEDSQCSSGYCINTVCCAFACTSQPDRRCGDCSFGDHTLCNAFTGQETPDCSGDMICNGSGVCVAK